MCTIRRVAALFAVMSILVGCHSRPLGGSAVKKPSEVPSATSSPPSSAPAHARSAQGLAAAKRGFRTRVRDESSRSGPPPAPPPNLFTLNHYTSPAGSLPAYVTPRPADGKRRPAIVWLQGGFDPSIDESSWLPAPAENDQSARAFREAGAVLMFPARRGGNDNPLPRETFFGEVDDVIAAADFVAKLDYVDPSRVYLGGHSTGGTLALLVAESTDRFRAVFSFGPVANILNYGDDVTFDTSDEAEVRLRSPMFFLSSIRTPTFIFEGAARPSNADALPYLTPEDPSVPVRTHRVEGVDHFSILAHVTWLLAKKIVDPSGDVAVTDAELNLGRCTERDRTPPGGFERLSEAVQPR